jgi:hypothetical protein
LQIYIAHQKVIFFVYNSFNNYNFVDANNIVFLSAIFKIT